jgi:LysM repeat protein
VPDFKPNYFVRAIAVLALIAALILVVVVIITTSSDSSDGDSAKRDKPRVSKVGRNAVRKGVWVVQSGDTLGAISVTTGVDQNTLLELNPDLDPQALLEGQRIRLR